MAPLNNDLPREYSLGDIEDYPVINAGIVFEGSAVGEDGNGYSRALQAGDVFQGFCLETADNRHGNAGDIRAHTRTKGRITLAIPGLAITSNDRPAVYASDDNTFTLSAAGNSLIGYVSRWEGAGMAVVEFDAALARAALQA